MPPQEISKPEGSSSPNDDNRATASKAPNAASLYHHDQPTEDETEGCRKILEELSPEEIVSMPDDHMPLRHLRAEKGDVKKAVAKLKGALAWRLEFEVDKILKAVDRGDGSGNEMTSIIQKENETSKLYVRGYDKDGRALLYMRPAQENTSDAVNQMRHLVWNLEKAIACSAKNGRSKICIVIDYEGFAIRHSPPLSTTRYTLDILQKHYPERMYRGYVCNPPMIFRTFWAMAKPFIDPITKTKIVFCTGKKGLAQLAGDVGAENLKYLEPCAGGTMDQPKVDSATYLRLPFDQTFGEEQ